MLLRTSLQLAWQLIVACTCLVGAGRQHLLGVWVPQGDVAVDMSGHRIEVLLLPDKSGAGGVIVTMHEH